MSDNNKKSVKEKLGVYVSLRVFLAVVITVVCLWSGSMIIKFFSHGPEANSPYQKVIENNPTLKKMDGMLDNVIVHEEHVVEEPTDPNLAESHDAVANESEEHAVNQEKSAETHPVKEIATKSKTSKNQDTHAAKDTDAHSTKVEIKPVQDPEKDFGTHAVETHGVRGSAFAQALIKPLNHEINERTFGWRPNDIFSFFTDNIENYQLGVLEVTRRAATTLVERIARTGSNITFDKNLDSARTKFMNDPRKYWLPAPEDAYGDALEDIETYRERLNKGKATFHARADNLVPLLEAFENLLGDCDESLVKRVERNGSQVSTFMADDYFYYSKGVASAMATILHAVMEDFGPVLDSRGAAADLHHAILMLDAATELDPLFIQESNLNGLFANHRANMATVISHARSYIQFVLKTMTT